MSRGSSAKVVGASFMLVTALKSCNMRPASEPLGPQVTNWLQVTKKSGSRGNPLSKPFGYEVSITDSANIALCQAVARAFQGSVISNQVSRMSRRHLNLDP